MTTTVSSLVSNGKLTKHPIAGMFQMWLRGRTPTTQLACEWLNEAEGMLLALQHDVNANRFAENRVPVECYPAFSPKPALPRKPLSWQDYAKDDSTNMDDLFNFWEEEHHKEDL